MFVRVCVCIFIAPRCSHEGYSLTLLYSLSPSLPLSLSPSLSSLIPPFSFPDSMLSFFLEHIFLVVVVHTIILQLSLSSFIVVKKICRRQKKAPQPEQVAFWYWFYLRDSAHSRLSISLVKGNNTHTLTPSLNSLTSTGTQQQQHQPAALKSRDQI